MPRLVSSPTKEQPREIMPEYFWCPSKASERLAPATVPVIAARNVPNSRTPLPQDKRFSGRISGNSPYFDGPNSAPWVLARKSAARDIDMLWRAKPAIKQHDRNLEYLGPDRD